MNILYLCADPGIPIRGHKGAAVHVRALIAALDRAGHRVTLLTPRPGPAGGSPPRADMHVVPLPPEATGALRGDARLRAYSQLLAGAALELLDRDYFDFLYERHSLWSDVGARLRRWRGVPLVLEVNAPLVQEAARYRSLEDPAGAASVEAAQFKAADLLTAVSAPLADYLRQRGAPAGRVHVLPNGVDPAHFHPAVRGGSVRGRYGLQDRTLIGFVGRPRPWHDLDTLLAAVARLRRTNGRDRPYHLLLVGEMPADLPARLADHGLTDAATATGPVAHNDVPRHIAAMDVAVSPHPDLADFYFSPLKLFEYLACGVPTVAAAVGQPAALIQPGRTGALYPPGDAIALAQRIADLVNHPARTRQIAWQGAVQVLERHTWDRNAAAILSGIAPAREQGGSMRRGPMSRPIVPVTGRSLATAAPATARPFDGTTPLLDRKLRQRLYRATSPELALPFLARHIPLFQRRGPRRLKEIRGITVLKYKPGRRCVLGYDLAGRYRHDGSAWRLQIIGKVFRDDRGRRLHGLQRWLRRQGFGDDAADGIRVPASLAYVPEMRMQVQAYAPGQTLNDLVVELSRSILPAGVIALAAAGLARLHSLTWPGPITGRERAGARAGADSGPGSGPGSRPALRRYELADERANLTRFGHELEAIRPQAMAALRERQALLSAWADRLPPPPGLTPVHRDFYYSQVLVDDRGLTLIDFDLLALGDPAIDVANFVAHLFFLGLDRLGDWWALAEAAALFQSEYGRRRPVDDAFWERCRFYQAATFFRLLHVVAPRPGLAPLFEPILAQSRLALERV